MKSLLLSIVLLYSSQYAYADFSLQYKELSQPLKNTTLSYYIQGQKLRFNESGSPRINLFDAKTQQFSSFDPKSGKIEVMSDAVLLQRAGQLKQRRLKRIQQVEQQLSQKLKTMTLQEQQVGESMLNQLKYPELYGEHTMLTVKPLSLFKTIDGIHCQVYQLSKNTKRLKEFCFADADKLKISALEYRTLRQFYAFDYKILSTIMLAMGKSDFDSIDYGEHKIPGVMLESISYKNGKVTQQITLSSHSDIELDKGLFELVTE